VLLQSLQAKIDLLLEKYEINSLTNIICEILAIEPSVFPEIISLNTHMESLAAYPHHHNVYLAANLNNIEDILSENVKNILLKRVCENNFVSEICSREVLIKQALNEQNIAQLYQLAVAVKAKLEVKGDVTQAENSLLLLIACCKDFMQDRWGKFEDFCAFFLTAEFTPRVRLPFKAAFLKCSMWLRTASS
jgi:hypothetical protein